MAGEKKVASNNAVVLKEGARILVQITVFEDKEKGRTLKEGKYPIRTRADDGKRYIQRSLVYPFPMGLIEDPFTKKPAVDMTPDQLAASVAQWSKDIEALRQSGGAVQTTNADGKVVSGVVPVDVIPSISNIFDKGFKLEVQGPVNAQMVRDQVVTTGKRAPISKAAKTLETIG
jgi:hypothetical protein